MEFQFPHLQNWDNHHLPQAIQVTSVNTGKTLRMVLNKELRKHWQLQVYQPHICHLGSELSKAISMKI